MGGEIFEPEAEQVLFCTVFEFEQRFFFWRGNTDAIETMEQVLCRFFVWK